MITGFQYKIPEAKITGPPGFRGCACVCACVCMCVRVCVLGAGRKQPGKPVNLLQLAKTHADYTDFSQQIPGQRGPGCSAQLLSSPCCGPSPRAPHPSSSDVTSMPFADWLWAWGGKEGEGSSGRLGSYTDRP